MPRSEKSPQCTIKLQCYCDNQARWAVSRLHTQRQLILQDCNYKALINYTMITFITSTARQPRYCLFFTCQKIVHCVCVVSLCSPAISVPFVLFYLWLKAEMLDECIKEALPCAMECLSWNKTVYVISANGCRKHGQVRKSVAQRERMTHLIPSCNPEG